MKRYISIILNFILRFFPVNNNKIVFECGRGKIDDNPLAIYKYMIDNGYSKKYRLIFLVSKGCRNDIIKNNDISYYRTLTGYYHLATAKYWIRSQNLGGLVKKRKNQICIFTDHGIYGLKKCGYSIDGKKNMPPLEQTKEWDIYISSSANNSLLAREATGYKGKILELGLPRTDKLVNRTINIETDIVKKLNLNEQYKTILYAPTFRDDYIKKVHLYINQLATIQNVNVIITAHPLAKKYMEKYNFDKKFKIAFDYDINDLLLVTDLLITDYSSTIFDYLIIDKPIVFYPYDYKEYTKGRNGFYLDYKKDLPGIICFNEKDLVSGIKQQLKNDTFKKYRKEFGKKYIELCDGNSCKRFVDALDSGKFEK